MTTALSLQATTAFFLTLNGPMYNLKIPSIFLQNFYFAWNGNFFQAIWYQSDYNRDVSERTLINQLKWVEKVINWKKPWIHIATRIN